MVRASVSIAMSLFHWPSALVNFGWADGGRSEPKKEWLLSSVELTRMRASIVLIFMSLVLVAGVWLFCCERTADKVSQRVSFQVMRVLIVAVITVVGRRRCLRSSLFTSMVWSTFGKHWADKVSWQRVWMESSFKMPYLNWWKFWNLGEIESVVLSFIIIGVITG